MSTPYLIEDAQARHLTHLKVAATHRVAQVVRITRRPLHTRILLTLGEWLIGLGQRTKAASTPVSQHVEGVSSRSVLCSRLGEA